MLFLTFIRGYTLKLNSLPSSFHIKYSANVCYHKNIYTSTSKIVCKKLMEQPNQKLIKICSLNCSSYLQKQNSHSSSKVSQISKDSSLTNQENELLREAPLVHYASKGILFVLCHSLVKKVSQPREKFITSKDSFVNEADLLKDSHNIFANGLKDKENAEFMEIQLKKEASKVSPIIGKIPINALQWKTQKIEFQNLPKYYAGLSKSRLTGLVVLTTMAGYAIAPAAFDLSGFLFCSLGTALISCSANSINQVFEVPYDSQMDRTKNRVLVRGQLTPLHAFAFGLTCSVVGLSTLYFGVNGITAMLGVVNLLIYTTLYTPLKRLNIINTWVGAIVGAIPPMMGWVGCTGALDGGVWILGAILYAWQFPHFNALSWNMRQDYSRAGYRMMAVTNPGLCQRTAFRYSVSLLILSFAAPICDVTTWTFSIDSLPLNLYFIFLAWKFNKDGDSKSSRKLFQFSLIHLPALLILMIISKKRNTKPDLEEPVR